MPYFLCPSCTLRAYSAAAECHCPSCDKALQRGNQVHVPVPHAESVGGGRDIPDPAEPGRFRRRSRRRVAEEGVQ
jgi:hypothetical protein